MSNETDGPVEIHPVQFFTSPLSDEGDFRAVPVPADQPDPSPKDSPALESVESSEVDPQHQSQEAEQQEAQEMTPDPTPTSPTSPAPPPAPPASAEKVTKKSSEPKSQTS